VLRVGGVSADRSWWPIGGYREDAGEERVLVQRSHAEVPAARLNRSGPDAGLNE